MAARGSYNSAAQRAFEEVAKATGGASVSRDMPVSPLRAISQPVSGVDRYVADTVMDDPFRDSRTSIDRVANPNAGLRVDPKDLSTLGQVAKGLSVAGGLAGQAELAGALGLASTGFNAAAAVGQQRPVKAIASLAALGNPAIGALNALDALTGGTITNTLDVGFRNVVQALTEKDLFETSTPAGITQGNDPLGEFAQELGVVDDDDSGNNGNDRGGDFGGGDFGGQDHSRGDADGNI